MTSYGRNKNHDDEIKKTKRRPIIAPAIAVRLLMNELEKPFRKKSDRKNRTVKLKVKLSYVNKKSTSEKANFCSNTVLSLYFIIRAKKYIYHAAKPLAFSFHFLFQRDQNHYSNLISKIMKICEQIFKRRQRLNTIQIL